MKKIVCLLFCLALSGLVFMGASYSKDIIADGCYLCQGGGYVKYTGSDTFDKRKKAEALGCKVNGTTGSCSNPKGTVN